MKKTMRWGICLICVALLIVGGALIFMDNVIVPPEPYAPPPSKTPSSGKEGSEPTEPTQPVKIYFTERELMCEIQPVGMEDTGEIGSIRSASIAAWYEDGAIPGQEGNAIINGHVRWKGKKGTFSILKDLANGEKVAIEFQDGSVKYFAVDTVDIYRLDDFPTDVLEPGGDARLTLITCLGDYNSTIGTSESRVVAVCYEV